MVSLDISADIVDSLSKVLREEFSRHDKHTAHIGDFEGKTAPNHLSAAQRFDAPKPFS